MKGGQDGAQRDANLLFGILAVQLRLVSPQQLVGAAALWATDQQRSLGSVLVEQGVISSTQAQAIEGLIAAQTQAHGGDTSQIYELYGGDAAAERSFGGSVVFERSDRSVRYESLQAPASAEPDGRLELDTQLGDSAQLTSEHPGRYSRGDEVGRGGVGRVLIAYDGHIHREIALKELLPESGSAGTSPYASPLRRSAALTARFLREARITGQLAHPGIVPVYELGRHGDGTVYYTMKLVRGQPWPRSSRPVAGLATGWPSCRTTLTSARQLPMPIRGA